MHFGLKGLDVRTGSLEPMLAGRRGLRDPRTSPELVAGTTSPGWAAWIGEAYRSILATKHGGRAWLCENIPTRGQFPSSARSTRRGSALKHRTFNGTGGEPSAEILSWLSSAWF